VAARRRGDESHYSISTISEFEMSLLTLSPAINAEVLAHGPMIYHPAVGARRSRRFNA
jgi:hypothetical protein